MSNQFNQSLLNTNILTSGNTFEDAEFSGNSVFSDTIDLTGITSITGLVDGTSLDEASGVISVKNLGITTTKINDLAITTGKVNDLAITTAKINDLAITTGKVANSSITNDKIVSMDASKLTGTIPNPFDQDLNTTDNVQFGTITSLGIDTSGENIQMGVGGVFGLAGSYTGWQQAPNTYTNYIQNMSGADMTIISGAGGKIDVYSSGNLFMNTGFYCNDSNAYIRNSSDTSKILKFDASGISASTTRTLTAPNSSGTIALTSDLTTFLTPSSTNNNVSNKSFEDSSTYFYDNSVNTKKFSFECSGLSGSRVFTAPDANGTLVLDTATMTISNKTYPCASNVFEQDGSYLKFDVSGMATGATATIALVAGGSYTYTFPDVGSASQTVAYISGAQTFSNKSLTGPLIYNPTLYNGAATISLPSGTGTLISRESTDTGIVNKTFTANSTYFADSTDSTKKLYFQTSGMTTAKTTKMAFNMTDDKTILFKDFSASSMYVVGEVETATLLNKTIDAADNTLRNHTVVLSNALATVQNVAAGSFTKVQFDTLLYDSRNGSTTIFTVDLANDKVVCKKGGFIAAYGSVRWLNTSGTTFRELAIYKNTTNMNNNRSSVITGTQVCVYHIFSVAVNDEITLQAFTTTNAADLGDNANLQTKPFLGVSFLSV